MLLLLTTDGSGYAYGEVTTRPSLTNSSSSYTLNIGSESSFYIIISSTFKNLTFLLSTCSY